MKIKSNKGVTLIVLTIMVVVLLIITGMLIYGSKSQIRTKKLNELYDDIEILNSKVSEYYLKNGNIPLVDENTPYITNTSEGKDFENLLRANGANEISFNVNDDENYYVLDINKLDNLTLNYGQDVQNWKTDHSYAKYQDIYIINKISHQIYFPHGIRVGDELYYTRNVDEVKVSPKIFQQIENTNINLSVTSDDGKNLLTEETSYFVMEDSTKSLNANVELQFTNTEETNYQINSIYYGWSTEKNDNANVSFTKFSLGQDNKAKITSKALGQGTYYLWIKIIDNYGNEYLKTTQAISIIAMHVGDYIDYSPDVAETVTYSNDNMTKYSGYTGTDYNVDLKRDTTMKWQVLRINEDGSMDIIGTPTTSSVKFYGVKGYNNGVYLMNDICKTLYSNSAHNIEARSVNQDDMEKWLTDDVKDASGNVTTKGGKTAKSEKIKSYISSLSGGTSYIESVDTVNNTVTYKKNYSCYPILAGHENGIGIDTDVKTDGIGLSEENVKVNNTPLIPTEKTSAQAENNLAVKQTYYDIAINSTNYGAGAKALSKNRNFWVASRYVYCYSDSATFGLRYAYPGTIGDHMFHSYGGISSSNIRPSLRPVVTLRSDVQITPSSTASNKNGTPHHINW